MRAPTPRASAIAQDSSQDIDSPVRTMVPLRDGGRDGCTIVDQDMESRGFVGRTCVIDAGRVLGAGPGRENRRSLASLPNVCPGVIPWPARVPMMRLCCSSSGREREQGGQHVTDVQEWARRARHAKGQTGHDWQPRRRDPSGDGYRHCFVFSD